MVSVATVMMHGPREHHYEHAARWVAEAGEPDDRVIDHAGEGIWPTARRAFLRTVEIARERGDEWCWVVQEDIVPAPGAREGLPVVLAHAPADVVEVYTGRQGLVDRALRHGVRWVRCGSAPWGGGVIMRPDRVEHFVAFCDARVPWDYEADDGRVVLWAETCGVDVAVTVPSLVQHVRPEGGVHGSPAVKGRVAPYVATKPAAEYDWSPGATPPLVDYPARLSPVLKRLMAHVAEQGGCV